MKKVSGGVTTYYVRDAQGRVVAEYDGAGTLSAAYVYAGERRIARVSGGSRAYYLADHLGSTRALMDDSGAIPTAYDYWPYGEVLLLSGTDAARYKFTGYERDGESGLDYTPARAYASGLGRFLKPDRYADRYPGISPYAYTLDNPMKYTDATGDTTNITVTRTRETKITTQGEIAVTSTVVEDTFEGYTLEPGPHDTHNRVRPGTYHAETQNVSKEDKTKKYDPPRIRLNDKETGASSGMGGVQIHEGTRRRHTTGCIVVGCDLNNLQGPITRNTRVFSDPDSKAALRAIDGIIAKDGGPIIVRIIDNVFKPPVLYRMVP